MREDPWYAISVKIRFEWSVAANLQRRGFNMFLPSYAIKSQWSDRVKSRELPLFPGYLFCQFDLSSRVSILTVPGVKCVVGAGKSPEAIDKQEIEALQTLVGSGLYYEPHPYLEVGQLVRVECGVLAGLTGLVTELKNSCRIVISINLLMRSVCTEIDRSWVKPIDDDLHSHFLRVQPASINEAPAKRVS